MTDIETIRTKLEESRRSLLDLSTRNRLLHTPRGRGRSGRLEIIEESTAEVFRILARDGKKMSFLAGKGSGESDADEDSVDAEVWFTQPDEDGVLPDLPALLSKTQCGSCGGELLLRCDPIS